MKKILKSSSRIIKNIGLISILLLSHNVFAQKLIESSQTSHYTYIFKITDQEAKSIYKSGFNKVKESFLHTLVDSFPTNTPYEGELLQGHYLKTYAAKNKQKFFITTIQDFEAFILNNNTDLSVQVVDLQGNIINNAQVKVGLKNLRFNKNTQSYTHKKSNQKGLLSVTHNQFTAYYELSRALNNPSIRRGARKVAYAPPVKYVWIPLNFIISFPIDAARSISYRWPQGTIYRTQQFFTNSFNRIASLFDDSYYNSNLQYKFQSKHKGYMVFNKPKYMPGDTVKGKAFIVNKKGKPIDKPVKLLLETPKKKIEIAQLPPYTKGGYDYSFYLHDSLELQLDRSYRVSLGLSHKKVFITEAFKYEDYELSGIELTLRTDSEEHFKNGEFTLYAKGTDENDLNIMDARVELLLTPKVISQVFDKQVFFPDTLLFLQERLEPVGETEIIINDSAFPKANFEYNINARLLTSDNEVMEENKHISYFYHLEDFKIELKTDSIHFEYLKNGEPTPKQVVIYSEDNFGNQSTVYKGITPYHIELNPYFSSYTIQADSLAKTLHIAKESSLLQCFSERTIDSVSVWVNNPRKIPFIYHIYKKNSTVTSGYTDSLSIQQESSSKQNYFVSIRYLWGGIVKEEMYQIPLMDKELNVAVTQPKLVYPGQKSKIDILVTDQKGEPVEGVDLTAYSFTNKFDYSAPQLPYLGKERKGKEFINRFFFRDFNLNNHPGIELNYDLWKTLAGIDSVEYYNLIYPQNYIYRFEYDTEDSITQFAPFIVSKGNFVPIHIIYVDNKPVYFSWSTNTRPYSFAISSGYHTIKLRTANQEIEIDNIYFEKDKKLIFSLDKERIKGAKNIKIATTKPKLSQNEKFNLYRYILPYDYNFTESFAYIEQKGNPQLLNPNRHYRRLHFAGPVSGNLTFNLLDGYSTTFVHEPFFKYEFSPTVLKMRSIEEKEYPQYLWRYNNNFKLSDTVLTNKRVEGIWEEFLELQNQQRSNYTYFHNPSSGTGNLQINWKKEEKPLTHLHLNTLIYKCDSDELQRIYPGNTLLFQNLQEGYYRLIFFYSGTKHAIHDSLYIKPNGLNHLELEQPHTLKQDTFSTYISQVIDQTILNLESQKRAADSYNMRQQHINFSGEGYVVEGYIYEQQSHEPLIGAIVRINETVYGAVTNLDGYYSIRVPKGYNRLTFSSIGCNPQEHVVYNNSTLNVFLEESELRLEEVVVIGYGAASNSFATHTVSSVLTGSQMGGMTGGSKNILEALQGQVSGINISRQGNIFESGVQIKIQGTSSIEFDKTPLFIVNGSVFMGDISMLNSASFQNLQVLSAAEASAIYGHSGANGVVIIDTEPGTFQPQYAIKGAEYDETFLEAVSQSSSIRNNFSDYAFWQPNLTTNDEGKAQFDVVFPDDVTSWQTFYLAMNGKRQSGQTQGFIKSYKPLMAQLAVPRFLIEKDTSFAIGKVLNYSPQPQEVKTRFVAGDREQTKGFRLLENSLLDTLPLLATNDSLGVKYYLETQEGYFDGEKRDIPILPQGLEATKGEFHVLRKDTTLQLQFDASMGTVKLFARADLLTVLEDEIRHIIGYKYTCNEQEASKLKALLVQRQLTHLKGKKFNQDIAVKQKIRYLLRNQKPNGLWGWWKSSKQSLWISLHVLEALSQAEQAGYKNSLNKDKLTEQLIWELENSKEFYEKVRIVKIANLLGLKIDYQTYIADLEAKEEISLNGLLHIIELKQSFGMDYSLDTLDYFKNSTLLGNRYYSDGNILRNISNNDMQNSLLAYRILRADSTADNDSLILMQNYFLENRKSGYWRNTFESAKIIETILPDLLTDKPYLRDSELKLKGDTLLSINEFPFEISVKPTQTIEVVKTGDYPVYISSHQRYWESTPSTKSAEFEISTDFDNKSSTYLTAGKEVKLTAKVTIKEDAEYVLINIPIPGGCSYAQKGLGGRHESHREYFKNETTIFCDYLPKGEHIFEISLTPRYSGTYTLNPAKVELMYFPTFNANNEIKTIEIK